jgi:hypothetical protein
MTLIKPGIHLTLKETAPCVLTTEEFIMNRFQAMAQTMAMLCEGGHLKQGTAEYKLARKLIAGKIDRLGPEATIEQVEKWRGHLLDQIDIMSMLQDLEKIFPYGES